MRKSLMLFISMILVLSILFIFLTYFSSKPSNKIYILELMFDDEKIYFKNVYVKDGYPRSFEELENGYKCIVISNENKVLHSFTFLLPDKWLYDYIDEETGEIRGGVEEIKSGEIVLTIPYFENGNKINIYDKYNKLMLSVDISKFSKRIEIDITAYLLFLIAALFVIILVIVRLRKRELNHHLNI
ncbi:MAG: hypothetical protein QXL09_01805 [Candidatus Aenigmatarchaeota archaeon]